MTLQQINARARSIRRGNKNIKWKTAIKQAAAELRGGSKKKSASRKSRVKKSAVRSAGAGTSVSQHVTQIRGKLETRLGDLFVQKTNATTKTRKRQIQKQISEVRSKLNKVKQF